MRINKRIFGFCLIECLITLIILNIGILGIIKIYAHAFQFSYQASSYETLANVSHEIVQLLKSRYKKLESSIKDKKIQCNVILEFKHGLMINQDANSCINHIFSESVFSNSVSSYFDGLICIDVHSIKGSDNPVETRAFISVVSSDDQIKDKSCFHHDSTNTKDMSFEVSL